MKVRIKDIARLAQVSTGTVDRVLHNRGEVSEKTRKKIEDIIQELDYQPDILARTLASKKYINFDVLMPVSDNENDFWNFPRTGIYKAREEINHFGVEINNYYFDQFDVSSFKLKAKQLLADQPDAILFAPVFPSESKDFIRECMEMDIPVLLFNSNLEEGGETMYIGQDAVQSGYLAGSLINYALKDAGEILIVNIAGRKDNHNHILRRERGFRKFFVQHPNPDVRIITVDCTQDQTGCLPKLLEDALSRYRVRAIFVTNSRVYQVAEYFEENDIQQIRLLGYDLLPQNIKALKKGTIDFLISQKPEEQGYKGIMTLFNKIVLKKEVAQFQYLPIDIITKENIDYYEYK